MTGLVILAVLLVLAAAAPRYGVDSRWGQERAPRHTVLGDMRAVSGRIRRSARTPR